ncbi:MAG: endonuclease III domain-containing protein [Candidatus Desulfofervidaceae bacterium]|nr:endonuclease III domain-containing protein [Candidatus Desulfofervidaceae bacterium]
MELLKQQVSSVAGRRLMEIYETLFQHFGPQHWWPGETPFEIVVGAILTQNTAWKNVEKAINNLKKANLLTPQALYALPYTYLTQLIRPAGFFNVKAKRLKHFLHFLFEEYKGDLEKMFADDTDSLRKKLLEVPGIGPETADSILLYAGNKPSFVVDAYTRRILFRHNLIPEEADYEEVRNFFMDHLPEDVQLFNEYHALLIALGKNYCRPKPLCENCPLKGI